MRIVPLLWNRKFQFPYLRHFLLWQWLRLSIALQWYQLGPVIPDFDRPWPQTCAGLSGFDSSESISGLEARLIECNLAPGCAFLLHADLNHSTLLLFDAQQEIINWIKRRSEWDWWLSERWGPVEHPIDFKPKGSWNHYRSLITNHSFHLNL